METGPRLAQVWPASAIPRTASAIPASAEGPSVSPNSGQAIQAVQGGTKK